jgi:hypothetical protein
MVAMDKLKISMTMNGSSWRALLMRVVITLVLLAAVLKIGS